MVGNLEKDMFDLFKSLAPHGFAMEGPRLKNLIFDMSKEFATAFHYTNLCSKEVFSNRSMHAWQYKDVFATEDIEGHLRHSSRHTKKYLEYKGFFVSVSPGSVDISGTSSEEQRCKISQYLPAHLHLTFKD